MINLDTTHILLSRILLLVVYMTSVSISGYIQAWVAKKCDDTTPEDTGFLTLNPLVHSDIIGLLALILTGLGWPRLMLFNPHYVSKRHKLLKLGIMHATGALVCIALAVIALCIALTCFGGTGPIDTLLNHVFRDEWPFTSASYLYADKSSSYIIGALLSVYFVFFNVFIAMFYTVFNGFRYLIAVGFERGYKYVEHSEILTILGPLLFLFIFGSTLRYYILISILWMTNHIVSFLPL